MMASAECGAGASASSLMALRARTANADRRDEIPACGSRLRARQAGHSAEQGLHRVQRGQIDGKAARAELAITLGVLDRRQAQHLNPVEFLALCLAEPVEAMHEPSIGR